MSEEIKYNEIEDLDYCLELLEDRDKENYSLSQENSFLKYHIGEKEIEIDRLNNIVNELEKFIELALEIYNNVDVKTLELVKTKLQELKGSGSND